MKELKTNRIVWLDTLRVLAILMVIFMHAPMPNLEIPLTSSYLLGGLSYLTMPCIGLLFMVSGALILPVKLPLKDFLKRRFSRILFPTIIWSLFYITIKCFYSEIDLTGVGKLLLQIPFNSVEGILWFMYTLIGLYLFAPIVSKWLITASKKDIQYFLVLWLIVMCLPYVNAFIKMRSDYHLLSTFSGFMGYMVLGYYLKRFPIDLKKSICIIKLGGSIFILSIILPAIFYIVPISGFNSGTVLYNYLSISVVMMCIGWFVLIQNMQMMHLNKTFIKLMKELSTMSFGIYLLHIFVMHRWIWTWIPEGTISLELEIIIVAILTFILSYVIVKIISYIPYTKYIIG
ncbi:acyltransferase [Ancylomarina sp. YFZ004]